MTSKRDISTLNETGTLQRVVKPVIYVRLDFASGVERYHTEIGPRTVTHPTHGAELYTGIGDFGGISSEIKESTDATPINLSISITGVDASKINLALTDDYFRRSADMLLGLEDTDGVDLDDPIVLYSGYMDKPDIALKDGLAQMTMNLESRSTILLRSSDVRYTEEDLQAAYPGDLAGEYIYLMADLQLKWGTETVLPGAGGGRSGGPGPRIPIHPR